MFAYLSILRGAQEAEIDAAAPGANRRRFQESNHCVGSLGKFSIADRKRRAVGFEPMVPDS